MATKSKEKVKETPKNKRVKHTKAVASKKPSPRATTKQPTKEGGVIKRLGRHGDKQSHPEALRHGITDFEYILCNRILADFELNRLRAYQTLFPDCNPRTANEELDYIFSKKPVLDYYQYLIDERNRISNEHKLVDTHYIITRLKRIAERCMQSEPVFTKDGKPTGEYKFDSAGAISALKLLGQHIGCWNESNITNINITGFDPARLEAGDISEGEATRSYLQLIRG